MFVEATGGAGDRELTATQTLTVTVSDVNEAPGVPDTPTVAEVTLNSLKVQWSAPTNTGPDISSYDMRYILSSASTSDKADDTKWTEVADAWTSNNGGNLAYTIGSLDQNTGYDIQVRAKNDEGTSSWSSSVAGTTKANVAPVFSSASTFEVDENSTSVVTVTATDADSDDTITGYAITGGVDKDQFEIVSNTGVLSFKTALDYERPEDVVSTDPANAANNNEYIVIVTATGGAGDRVLTTTQTLTVTVSDVNEAPGKPSVPTIAAVTLNSLKVSWTVPDNTGPAISAYDVRHIPSNASATDKADDTKWTVVTDAWTSGSLEYTISSLAQNKGYDIQVRAENDEGTGAWSDTVEGITKQNSAPSFTSIARFDILENKINVGVVVADDADSEDSVTGYAIVGGADQDHFSIVSGTGALRFKVAPNYELPTDVESIMPVSGAEDNEYIVVVMATSGAGVRTLTATDTIEVVVVDVRHVPEIPNVPIVTETTPSSVTVTWETAKFEFDSQAQGLLAVALDTSGEKIYWADGLSGIWRADFDGSNAEEVIGDRFLLDIALDTSEEKIYWAETGLRNKIQRADFDGSNVETIVTSGSMEGIALDIAGGKIYWTDSNANKIRYANLDGSNVEDVITMGLDNPQGIALDILHGEIYWLDVGTDKIRKVDLDGSNVEDVITMGLDNPRGIALDVAGNKIYWSDGGTRKIGRADLDGSNVEDVITMGLDNPRGIALDVAGNKIYWSDSETRKIGRADLDIDYDVQYSISGANTFADADYMGTDNTMTIVGLDGNTEYDIQVRVVSSEAEGGWSQSGEGMTRERVSPSFNVTSFDVGENNPFVGIVSASNASSYAITGGVDADKFLFFSDIGLLTFKTAPDYEMASDDNMDNSYIVEVTATNNLGDQSLTTEQAITVTVSDVTAPALSELKVTGSTLNSLMMAMAYELFDRMAEPRGLALDLLKNKMYWIDSNGSKIRRADLDGSNIENIITTGLNSPGDIAVDFVRGQIYWTEAGKVRRADLDGSDIEDIVLTGWPTVVANIALDIIGGKIYWTHSEGLNSANSVRRADLDGSNSEIIFDINTVFPRDIALDVSGGKIYWTDNVRDKKVRRADLDGSNIEDIVMSNDAGGSGKIYADKIALDLFGDKVYWTDRSNRNVIRRADLDGSNVEDFITSELLSSHDIVLDGGRYRIYWTDDVTNTIHWADIADYEVQYRFRGLGVFSNGNYTGKAAYLTLIDLDADTEYDVQVQATNGEGMSRWGMVTGRIGSLTRRRPPFKRGMNLSQWQQSPKTRGSWMYSRQTLANLKTLGCDFVRLPFNPPDSGPPSYTIDSIFFTYLDQIVDWAEELGLYVILDNHRFGLHNDLVTAQEYLVHSWSQVAARYKDRSNLVMYEVFNEPQINPSDWNPIQQEVINTIRAVDDTHTIVVTGGNFTVWSLGSLPNYTDDNLIYTFHHYNPLSFTHQGAPWISSFADLHDVPWPADPARVPPDLADRLSSYSSTVEELQKQLRIAVNFANSRNVPLWCGEFGVVSWAPLADRSAWLRTVRTYLEENDIAWSLWEYQGGFGVFEAESNEIFDYDLNVPVIEALGLVVPPQLEWEVETKEAGFEIYTDDLAEGISVKIWSGGSLIFNDDSEVAVGNFSIQWSGGLKNSNSVRFIFGPDLDLSTLVNNGYAFEFWVWCDTPGVQFRIRFMDRPSGSRMDYKVNEKNIGIASWDSQWHQVRIPLDTFVPTGAFTWKEVDQVRFILSRPTGSSGKILLRFDDIKISANVAPVIAYISPITVNENSALVTVSATDTDANDNITGYGIVAGADGSQFEITNAGVLTFKDAPNYEDAQDIDFEDPANPAYDSEAEDNEYIVIVSATSGENARVLTSRDTLTITVMDVDGEAPGKPAVPTISMTELNSLKIEWTAPTNTGPDISAYDVRYILSDATDKADDNNWTVVEDAWTSGTLEYTISNLVQNMMGYDIQVRAENDEGTGDWSDSGVGTTIENQTPVFVDISPINVSENSTGVIVTVSATDADNGDDIERYEIVSGADGSQFSINDQTGELSFKAAPNYEDAQDIDFEDPANLAYDSEAENNEYIVIVSATSGKNARVLTSRDTLTVRVTDDYDEDDDGLIEVSTLEQLNAIRYDLDGNGTVDDAPNANAYALAFPSGMVCPQSNCMGYELMTDLDFNASDSYASGTVNTTWTTGNGWEPIGTNSDRFTGTFHGGGYTLSNLFIDLSSGYDDVGLFGVSEGVILNVGLVNVNVRGSNRIGSLAGANRGTVSVSYATGQVSATGTAGTAGGLVGRNYGTIRTSYSQANLINTLNGGGLVGQNGGTLLACYAAGSVNTMKNAGGLVGWNQGSGSVKQCYAIGPVSSSTDNRVGGFFGAMSAPGVSTTFSASYWDSVTTGRNNGVGSNTGHEFPASGIAGRPTSELQSPTGYSGIYATWDDEDVTGDRVADAPWYFGRSDQYPILKVDFNDDGTATSGEFRVLSMPTKISITPVIRQVTVTWQQPFYTGNSPITAYDVRYILSSADETDDANWTVVEDAWTSGALKYTISPLDHITSYDIQVRAENAEGTGGWSDSGVGTTTTIDYDKDDDGLIEVSTLEKLNAIRYDLDGDGTVDDAPNENAYALAFRDAASGMGCPPSGCMGYELIKDLDFNNGYSYASGTVNTTWTTGNGWEPIGNNSDRFTGIFHGGGHTLSNLFIDRANNAGLFGFSTGTIKNVGLVDVNISGSGYYVGGLVGRTDGEVSNCYVTGQVKSTGWAGGLVGENRNTIRTSYARVSIDDTKDGGGLVGVNYGTLLSCYARGSVNTSNHAGGLIAWNAGSGSVRHCYTTASVSSNTDNRTGGFAGRMNAPSSTATFSDNYWDVDATGQSRGEGVNLISNNSILSSDIMGKTTSQLQSPTDYTDIYASWDDEDVTGDGVDDAPWYFGTLAQYPILKVDFNDDGTATSREFGTQLVLGMPTSLKITPGTQQLTDTWQQSFDTGNRPITQQLTVTWQRPFETGNSPITAYDVRYILSSTSEMDKADDDNWTLLEDIWMSGPLAYTITGLMPNTSYDVQVRAKNAEEAGDWSDSVVGTTVGNQGSLSR